MHRLWMRIFCVVCCLTFFSGTGLLAEPMLCVNSMADLKNVSPQSLPGMKLSALVKYRTQATDGGGGTFTWDPACTETPDDAIILNPNTNTCVGRWRRNFDGVISPSWFGALGDGSDDHAALQTAMDRPEPVCFDRSFCTVQPVEIHRTGKVVDFGGYTLSGSSTTAQDAVLWITGSNLTLKDVSVSCGTNPYTTAIHWMSTAADPSQNNRIYGLSVFYSSVGLLFGSYASVPNPPTIDMTRNYVYGVMFRGVNNCIQMNQPGGSLSIDGGNIDCGVYEWAGSFDASVSRCYKVVSGALRITNCELLKTQTQAGYGMEGPAVITNSHAEVASGWFLNPGNSTIIGLSGYLGNDSVPYFNVANGAVGNCVLDGCDFIRGANVAAYSNQPLIYALNAPDYRFTIINSTFTEWKQIYLTNGNARIYMENSRFPTDSGVQIECEKRFPTSLLTKSGSGSPEGVVRAPVGSIYQRADGGANTCLYIKQSGTSVTGWVAKTGWALAAQDLSITAAKAVADYTLVCCEGHVSGVYGDCFYVEDGDRKGGIRVNKTGVYPTLGQKIRVTGNVKTLPTFERYIDATSVTVIGLP